jgi:hypothetical protein
VSGVPEKMLQNTFGKNITNLDSLELFLNESIRVNLKRLEGKPLIRNKVKISRATTPKQLLDPIQAAEKKNQTKVKLRGFDWNRYMCEYDGVKPYVYGKLDTKQTLGSILLARKLKMES